MPQRLGLSMEPEERPGRGREPSTRSRRGVRPLVAGIVAIACAGALWFAYKHGHGGAVDSGDIPIIRADQGAVKVRPTTPGGDAAPDEDNGVYTMGKSTETTEHLLPPPEEPMTKPAPTSNAEIEPPAPVAQNPAPSVAAPPPPAPKPVAVPLAPAPVTPPKPVATVPPPAASGAYRVQIAATKDDATARSEWQRLQASHPDLLGSLQLTVVRADLGDRGIFFRIQAGAFADRGGADKLCTQLKAISIGCIIVHAN